MSPRRRALLLLAGAAVASLVMAAPALAAAGGGSNGFGGGGGGGGGRGAGLYILFQLLLRIAIIGHGLGALVIIIVVLAYLAVTRLTPEARGAWRDRRSRGRTHRRATARRERRVELAAAEAAEEDSAYAPEAVRQAAADLFGAVQQAWSRNDRAALARLVGPRLLAEWTRRLDDFAAKGWHNTVQVLERPTVQYVGLRRSGGNQRVVVLIDARLHDEVRDRFGRRVRRQGRLKDTVTLREFWTLRRTRGGWQLESIEQGAEGLHQMQDQLVATSWADEQALRDESLVEAASADAVPAGIDIAELADLNYAGDARAAALDLSLVDGRFAPDILEVCARRAISAWAAAIDGDDAPLRALASAGAVRDLLHPGDPSAATRLVLRGPRVREVTITGFEADTHPPRMTVEVAVSGRRYIEDRATTAVVAGDPTRDSSFRERWTFALSGDDAQPWRIVAVADRVAPR